MGLTVERIQDANGTHIEPPLNPNWTGLEKLQWWAAVTALDAGLPQDLFVVDEQEHEGQPPTYSLSWHGEGMAGMQYTVAWSTLAGVGIGARIGARPPWVYDPSPPTP